MSQGQHRIRGLESKEPGPWGKDAPESPAYASGEVSDEAE